LERDVSSSDVESSTPVLEALEIHATARRICIENVIRLIDELRQNSETSAIIEQFEKRLEQSDASGEVELQFLKDLLRVISLGKNSLSIKANELNLVDSLTVQKRDGTFSLGARGILGRLGFSDASYASFSDTKIALQLLDDLRIIIGSYVAPSALKSDQRRKTDRSPYALVKADESIRRIGQIFDVSVLRSNTNADIRNVLTLAGMTEFQQKFRSATTPVVRLKLLVGLLSRELRVSVGLSLPVVRDILKKSFGLADEQISQNVFEKIIGEPNASVFLEPVGNNQVLSRFFVQKQGEKVILPFEAFTIVFDSATNAVPGQKILIDSILQGKKILDFSPFRTYATNFKNAVTNFATVIEGTLDVNVQNSEDLGLNGDQLFVNLLSSLKATVGEFFVTNANNDSFFLALLHFAASDDYLRQLLLLYVIVVGYKNDVTSVGDRGFFSKLVTAGDFKTTTQFAASSDPIAAIFAAVETLRPPIQSGPPTVQTSQGTFVVDDATNRFPLPPPAPVASENVLDSLANFIIEYVASKLNPYPTVTPNLVVEGDVILRQRLATVGAGDASFIFRSIVEFVNRVHSQCLRSLSTNDDYYGLDSKSALTKFNNLGVHDILRIIFELYVTFFKLFPVVTFEGAKRESNDSSISFVLNRDQGLLEDAKLLIDQLLDEPIAKSAVQLSSKYLYGFDRERSNRFDDLRSSLSDLKSSFRDDDALISELVSIFISLGSNVSYAADQIEKFFDPRGPNNALIEQIQQSPDFLEKLSMLDSAQLALSLNSLLESKQSRALSEKGSDPFVVDTLVDPRAKAALVSLLRDPSFASPSGDNLSILTVGLPAGFSATLQNRINTFFLGQSFERFNELRSRQNDIIRIHVNMKDLLFEDIVFKPLKFDFELGRFVNANDFDGVRLNDSRDFGTLLRSVIKTHVLAQDGSKFVSELGVIDDPSYSLVLDQSQKETMIGNHVKSYLLRLYTKLLTGIDLTEDKFLLNAALRARVFDDESQRLFSELVVKRISGLVGRSLTLNELQQQNREVRQLVEKLTTNDATKSVPAFLDEVFDDASKQTNIILSEDLVAFSRLFSPNAILFGASSRKTRLLSPKLFDRVFNIPIDPDDFEVDIKTMQTFSTSRSFLESQIAKTLLFERQVKTSKARALDEKTFIINPRVRREYSNMGLRQVFVSIEHLVPDIDTGVSNVISQVAGSVESSETRAPSNERLPSSVRNLFIGR
jgi:hypothetical protein